MEAIFNYTNVNSNKTLESRIVKRLKRVIINYPIKRVEIFLKKEKANAPNNHIFGIWLYFIGFKIYISHGDKSLNEAVSKTIKKLGNKLKNKKMLFN